jgi:hypothetical protein
MVGELLFLLRVTRLPILGGAVGVVLLTKISLLSDLEQRPISE